MLHIDVFQDWYLFHAERCSGSDALGFIGFHCWRDAACFPQALASPTCWSSQVLKLPSIGLWEALRSLCSPSITVASLIVAETPGGDIVSIKTVASSTIENVHGPSPRKSFTATIGLSSRTNWLRSSSSLSDLLRLAKLRWLGFGEGALRAPKPSALLGKCCFQRRCPLHRLRLFGTASAFGSAFGSLVGLSAMLRSPSLPAGSLRAPPILRALRAPLGLSLASATLRYAWHRS